MSNLDLAFGVWTPTKLAQAARRYLNATAAPGSAALVRAGANQLTGLGVTSVPGSTAPPLPGQQSSGAKDAVILALIGGAVLLLGLRVAAAWYVGKQFGRPTSGAIVGGIFGAPGLGVLSLFPGRKARPNPKTIRSGPIPKPTSARGKRARKWECHMVNKSESELADIVAQSTHQAKIDAAREILRLKDSKSGLLKTVLNLKKAKCRGRR